jgi:anthranilate phosphoribosyltransferase
MSPLEQDFARILDGAASEQEALDFLARSTDWMADPAALAAGARALRQRMTRVAAPEGAIDVCGTGGDGAHTLNISTAVAFVVAGAGVTVAKHGNRAMSSKCGAADVLEALGVKLVSDASVLERCLNEAKLAFLFAQNHHPALRHVAAARRAFGKRTIFNLLGPLANPAGVKRQLVGVFAPEYVQPMAAALRQLGCERFMVVHGAGGQDEVSAAGKEANDAAMFDGATLSLQTATLAAPIDPGLRGGDARENARELRALLDGGGRGAYRAAVLINAAAALFVAGRAASVIEGHALASETLASDAPRRALEKLIAITAAAP